MFEMKNNYSSSELHNNVRCSRTQLLNITHYESLSKSPTIESDIKVFENMLKSYYHPPKLVLSKLNMNHKFISCYLINFFFRRTHEDNKDSLNKIFYRKTWLRFYWNSLYCSMIR